MIKAIFFFDIDGTLLDHSPEKGAAGYPPLYPAVPGGPCGKRASSCLWPQGASPAMVTFLEDLFPFDGFVTLNGQLALDREGRVLHRMTHHPQDIRKLAELVEADPFPCLVIEEKDSFFMVETPIIREHFQKEGSPPRAATTSPGWRNTPSCNFWPTYPKRRPSGGWPLWSTSRSPLPAGPS